MADKKFFIEITSYFTFPVLNIKKLMRGLLLFTFICFGLQASGQGARNQAIPDSMNPADSFFIIPFVTVSAPQLHSFQTESIVLDSAISQSLGQTLQNEPGIAIKANGAGGLSTLSVGGFAGNHTAVIWNDLNLQSTMNGFADLRTIPTFLFNTASIYKGAMSAPGGGGLGGSINLESGSEEQDIFKYPFNETKALLQMGSFGQKTLGLGYCRKIKKVEFEIKALLDGVKNNFNYMHPANGRTELNNAKLNQQHLSGNLSFPFSNLGRVNLDFWYSNIYRQIPPTLFEPKSLSFQTDENIRLNLDYRHKLAKNLLLKTALSALDDDIQYNDSVRSIFGSNHATLLKLNTQLKHFSRKTKFTADSFKIISDAWSLGTSYSLIQAHTNNYIGTIKRPLVAAFANWEHRTSVGISTVLAARIENFNSQTPITGQLDIVMPITKKTRLIINLGRAFRFATLNDMYWAPGGNPDLKPESSWKFNFNLNHNFKIGQQLVNELKFEESQAIVSNWIAWAPGNSGFWEATNYQSVLVQNFGLSNSSSWHRNKCTIKLNLSASLTLSRIADGPNANKQVPYIPVDQRTATLSLHHLRWYTALSFNQVGTRFTNADNSEMLSSYGLMDYKIGAPIKTKYGTFNINLQFNNLLNANYFSTVAYPMPGRNYLISFLYKPSIKQS